MLIIDRDETEKAGIEWFIKANQMRFNEIYYAPSIQRANRMIKDKQPDVVIIELDMLTKRNISSFSIHVKRYCKRLISITAEPLFERAQQAIELNSSSLLVKPFNLKLLQTALMKASHQEKQHLQQIHPEHRNQEVYHSLFMDAELGDNVKPYFLLIEPEDKNKIKVLYQWLHQLKLPFSTELFPLSHMVVCLAYPIDSSDVESIRNEAHKMLQWGEEAFDFSINIAIHDCYLTVDNLKHVYDQTKNALQLKFYKGFKQVFLTSDTPTFVTFDPFLTSAEQRMWITSLEKGDINRLKDFLHQSFTITSNTYPEPEIVRIKLTSILAQIRRFIKNYKLSKIDEIEREYHTMFSIILNSPILYTIIQELILFCIKVTQNAHSHKQNGEFDYIERSIFYLENHYQNKNLKLDDIASYLDISPNYLSSLLSAKQKPFKKILSTIRIQAAKKQLKETDYSIQLISDQVGYKDPNYFSRSFKKVVGLSPKEYRSF
ncbi:helix-turn-helix domain-containing protein [Pontibacillus litoralis]|nr:helix-turn-helix domain-containing protein [Pontibacillus litoralis]